MKVAFWAIGKTNPSYLQEGIDLYRERLQHYLSFSLTILPDSKKAGKRPPEQLKEEEGKAVLRRLKQEDFLILLDEKGKAYSSEAFAAFLDKRLQHSGRRLVFLVGGAYGFSEELYRRADDKLSLSPMTFSHQMVRLFFMEQLYRAMTILRNEPYHNR